MCGSTGITLTTGGDMYLCDKNIYLNEDNYINFDHDGDSFATIRSDASNICGYGNGALIIGSTSDKIAFIEGETGLLADALIKKACVCQYIMFDEYASYPITGVNKGALYTRDNGGVTDLYYRASDYTISQLSGGIKDYFNAYDFGSQLIDICCQNHNKPLTFIGHCESTSFTRTSGDKCAITAINYYDDEFIELEAINTNVQSGDLIYIFTTGDTGDNFHYVDDADGTNLVIEGSYEGDDSGYYIKGDTWTVPKTGEYLFNFGISAKAVAISPAPIFKFMVLENSNSVFKICGTFNSTTEDAALAFPYIKTLVQNRKIQLVVQNLTNDTNLCVSNISLIVTKL